MSSRGVRPPGGGRTGTTKKPDAASSLVDADGIAAPSAQLDLDALRAIAEAVAARRDLWEDRLPRDGDERTYTGIHSSEHLGVWAISWMAPDHDTGFHDHDRSRGAVAVAEGAIRHEHLRADEPNDSALVAAGDSFVFDETAIHRMRHDPNGGPTVTIHAYSPPLAWTGQYDVHGHDGRLHRIPTSSEQPLEPQ